MRKTEVNGKIMWESVNGERFLDAGEKPKDLGVLRKIEVDGKIMWESRNGERVFNR